MDTCQTNSVTAAQKEKKLPRKQTAFSPICTDQTLPDRRHLSCSLPLTESQSPLKLRHSDHLPPQDTGSTSAHLTYKGTPEQRGKWLPAHQCTAPLLEVREGERKMRWRRDEREREREREREKAKERDWVRGRKAKENNVRAFAPQSPTRSRLRPLFLLKKSFVKSWQSYRSKPLSENKDECVCVPAIVTVVCVRVCVHITE